MAANPVRELLQICSLSWAPSFITHRHLQPGPGTLLPGLLEQAAPS